MRKLTSLLLGILIAGIVLLGGSHLWHSRGVEASVPRQGQLRIASLNTHYIVLDREDGPWSVAGWDRRKGAMAAQLGTINADIVAFQEMESFRRGDGSVNLARDYLLEQLPAYAAAATGDWREFPSTQPIFYRRDRFRLIDQGWFFFSETPDVIYSRSFDGNWPAFASWALLQDRDGRRLRVLNVHFDYSSGENRLRSADLVAERIAPWIAAGDRLVVIGDLNAIRGSKTATKLQEAGLALWPAAGASYHLNRGINLFPAIDHVLLAPGMDYAARPVLLREAPGGVWPSDHYPLVADLDYR